MRFHFTIYSALLLGCQPKDADDSPDTGPDWWETSPSTGTGTDTDPTEGDGKTTDKTTKTTDSKSEGDAVDGWSAVAEPDAGTGTLSLGEEGCEVTFSLGDFSPRDDCESCSFAHSFVLSSPTVVTEGTSGCDAALAHDGERWQHGQGTEVTLEFYGISYHDLFAADGDNWTMLEGGYSSAEDGIWTFGKK